MEDITTLSHFPRANPTEQIPGSKTQVGWIPLAHVPMEAGSEVKSSTDESQILLHTTHKLSPPAPEGDLYYPCGIIPVPGAWATYTDATNGKGKFILTRG